MKAKSNYEDDITQCGTNSNSDETNTLLQWRTVQHQILHKPRSIAQSNTTVTAHTLICSQTVNCNNLWANVRSLCSLLEQLHSCLNIMHHLMHYSWRCHHTEQDKKIVIINHRQSTNMGFWTLCTEKWRRGFYEQMFPLIHRHADTLVELHVLVALS